MNLHEYQAKALFADFGMPVPRSKVASSAKEAIQQAKALGGDRFVVKAQVHAGGRGKAGGVKLVNSLAEVGEFAKNLLGRNLVTFQTDAVGQPINQVLIEEVGSIDKELYLGAIIDRSSQSVVIMASTEGGMDIEKVAKENPEKIHTISIDPLVGLMPYQARQLGFKLGLSGVAFKELGGLLNGLYQLFMQKDLALVEINPLVVTTSNTLVCLDGKINLDANALYRHPDLQALQDKSQEDDRELLASEWELSYVALEGDIGCMVNGAGLAMATMDVIKLNGGQPANFLDVGGAATAQRVAEAFKIITSDTKVKAILVNIFGGIVRCDLIAQGIIDAVKVINLKTPIVVRLEGNMSKEAIKMLDESDLQLTAASNLQDAAQKILKLSGAK